MCEWLCRAELLQDNPRSAIEALEEAVRTLDANKAVNGDPSRLWITLAKLLEKHESMDATRRVYERVCDAHEYPFKHMDDLARSRCSR